jgi:hypothetical protein
MISAETAVECLTSLKISCEIEGSGLRLAAWNGLLVGVFEVDNVGLSQTIVEELQVVSVDLLQTLA